jgi:hypothetical protein
VANVIPYRGMQDGIIPNRVWDLPPELGSDLEEAEEAIPRVGDVAVSTSAEISGGWTS